MSDPRETASDPRAPTSAAERALAEAAARRAEREAAAREPVPPEEGGRGGLDPVRYDDWEVGGIAVDF